MECAGLEKEACTRIALDRPEEFRERPGEFREPPLVRSAPGPGALNPQIGPCSEGRASRTEVRNSP